MPAQPCQGLWPREQTNPQQAVVLTWDIIISTTTVAALTWYSKHQTIFPPFLASQSEMLLPPKTNPSSWAELTSPQPSSVIVPSSLQLQPCFPIALSPSFQSYVSICCHSIPQWSDFPFMTSLKWLSSTKSPRPSNSKAEEPLHSSRLTWSLQCSHFLMETPLWLLYHSLLSFRPLALGLGLFYRLLFCQPVCEC